MRNAEHRLACSNLAHDIAEMMSKHHICMAARTHFQRAMRYLCEAREVHGSDHRRALIVVAQVQWEHALETQATYAKSVQN